MNERLKYGLNETGLQIATSLQVVHAVTARRGAMLDEVRRPASHQVHQLASGPDGTVVKFDFMELGKGYSGERQRAIALKVLDIVQQFEDVAAAEDWQDPRVHTSCPGTARSEYTVDVERPDGSDSEVTQKIEGAILYYARLLRLNNNAVGDRRDIRAIYDTQQGVSLTTHYGKIPTLSTEGTDYSPSTDRIKLQGSRAPSATMGQQALDRLVSFVGIVATLR